MDLKCRTLLKKTAWPGEGMQLLKNMGFKTAAMALRDDSVGIDNQTLQAEEKLAIVLGTEGDGLRIFLGVTDDRGLNDIGELTGAVRYDGQTLSLNPAELTYQEIA
mgnify:CR=1 FL=1